MVKIKVRSIDDAFAREDIERNMLKEERRQSKKKKINEKRNNPAYYLSLYRKTRDIKFYNKAMELRISKHQRVAKNGVEEEYGGPEVPGVASYEPVDVEEVKGESEIECLMREEMNRGALASVGEPSLVFLAHVKRDPYSRESVTVRKNIEKASDNNNL